MNRSLLTLWIVVPAASAALVVVVGSRAASARARAFAAKHTLVALSSQTAELVALRRGGQDLPERPEGGLATKISAAMSQAGLANAALQSLSPEAQTPLSSETGAKLSRQRATLTLSGTSLPQLGAFLNAWRTSEPDWFISGIDLSPINAPARESALGADLPLRAVLTIEGLFKVPAREPFLGAPR